MRKTEHDDPAYCHYQSKQWEEQPGEIQHLSGGVGAEILVPLAMSQSAYVYVYGVMQCRGVVQHSALVDEPHWSQFS